jgi:hypothetical protein
MQDSLTTPRFLTANTAKGLERAMLDNNLKRKRWHDYTIVFDGRKWFAWYYTDLSGAYNQEIEEIQKTEG